MFKVVAVGLVALAVGCGIGWRTGSSQAFVLTDGILGLIGVLLGLFMSTFLESLKETIRKDTVKKSLREELKLNLSMIPHKKRVLKATQAALSRGTLSPPKTFFFATAVYDQSFKTLSDDFSPNEAQSLHFMREYCRIIDHSIDNFFDLFKADLLRKPADEVAGMYGDFAEDIFDQLTRFEKYLIRHLDGHPIPIEEVVSADEICRGL